ncbi:MAG: hypothetical protein U0228_06270 [Myxococcaceae bacterium]
MIPSRVALCLSLLVLSAACGPQSAVGQPCRISPFVLEKQPCPSGYTCQFDSSCDTAECQGTCVVSCAAAPCGGACRCTSTSSSMNACFPPADAGPESCER